VAGLLGPVLAAGTSLVPVTVTTAAAAGITVAAAAAAGPAKASGLPVLVVLTGGEASAPEAALLTSAGYSVTQVPASALGSMSQATFQGYAAVVIGDPSSGGSCSSWQATTGNLGSNWQGWVTGNVAVLGTAPELAASLASPGNTAAATLVTDAAGYAAAQPGSGVTQTGLYLSLDCYSTSSSGTQLSVLNGVDGIGAAGGITVNTGLACADSGTVNKWEAAAAGTFGGFTSGSLVAGAPGWPSPACPVQEAFDSWPAMFTPLAYDAASDAVKDFTASDGAAGQPYVLLGSPVSAATQALAPSTGGEVPAGATSGGTSNPAAPGVSQASAGDPVNTETGAFTQSNTDFSIPTFGPPLAFTRTYDSGVAQQQTQTGTPGAMGYGWTDNWASSLTTGRPVAGDIYTLAGLRIAAAGSGGLPGSTVAGNPAGVAVNGGNTYFADSAGNRVLEVPGTTGTQWGQSMTAGDTYVVAGSGAPQGGSLNHPQGLAFDSSGDLYVADTWDNRIEEIPVTTKTQWGVALTANRQSTIAGSDSGVSGSSGDGGAAHSALLHGPGAIAFDANWNLLIADGQNNRLQEVAAVSGSQWGQSMTAGDVYTIAGSAAGAAGIAGDGGPSAASFLSNPAGVAVVSGNVIIADSGNNRVQDISPVTGTLWGQPVTAGDIYTLAGSATGTAGASGDGGAASAARLNGPQGLVAASGNLYIADAFNNRVRELPGSAGTQWGQAMTGGDIYTVAGNGTAGFTDNVAAASGELNDPLALALDGSSNLYIADASNNRIREVTASTDQISTYAGNGYTPATAGDGGPATQASLNGPMQEAFDASGNIYIADAGNNRIQEIAASTHTQFGISMTGGEVYTIAGHSNGQAGCACDGGPATGAYLNHPWGILVDPAGNLYIADSGNNRVQEVPAASGTQWGQPMTAGDMYTIAGQANGTGGTGGDGGPAASAQLNNPIALAMDGAGNIYIADSWNSRVQEIAKASGTQWGQAMTAGDIYTVTGSSTGAHGSSGDGGPAAGALLYGVGGLALDTSGDLYIGDGGNNRVQEIDNVPGTRTQWGQTMTFGDIYTVTGGSSATLHTDGGPATATIIAGAQALAIDPSGDLYIADEQNNRIQEIANVPGTQWGQSMTPGDEYTVAGSPVSAAGNSGDGGPATSALLANTQAISADPEGDLYITDNANATVREVASATANAITPAPGQASALAIAPAGTAPGGITVTQPGGAQVTFWPQVGGTCLTGYVATGSYCVLPQDQNATLTYNSGTQTYTYTPAPGSLAYAYQMNGAAGQLASETDVAGDALTITYNSPAHGTGHCPAAASSCQTITAASGRTLVIGSNASGLVTSVTDPLGRTWNYAYNTASQLTTATDPLGTGTTTYAYAGPAGSYLANDLTSITSPNAQPGGPDAGHPTVNAYDTLGRVTSQTDPMGFTTNFYYCVNAVTGNCMNPATGTGLVTVTDPDGNQKVYDYQQGTLAAQSEWTDTPGGLTFTSETDSLPDTAAASTSNPSGGTLLATAGTDGDGNTTTTSYNTAGNPVSATSPGANGTPATATTGYTASLQLPSCASTAEAAPAAACSQDSPPAPVAPGGAITPPSSAPPLGVTYTLYDTDGNELYTATGVYEPGSNTAAYTQTTYQLFKNNSVTLNGHNITCSAAPPSPSLPCAKVNADGVVTQLGYDSAGDLTSSATPDGNSGGELATTTYGYDGDGEQTSTTAPDGNLSGANAGNYTTITAWNNDAQKTSVSQGDGTGHTVSPRVTNYGYDGNGNQTTVQDARSYTTTTTYNADDKPSLVTNPDNNSTLACYDGDGNTAQTVPAVGVAANSLTVASCPTSYPAGYSTRLASDATTYAFNGPGLKTQMTTPAPAGQSGSETTSYAYDGNGNLVQTTAPPTANGGQNQVTLDTYTSAGQVASETTGYGTSSAATIGYCYDPGGDQTSLVYADGNTSSVAACETSSPWVVSSSSYPTQAAYQTTYSYDSVGELVSITTPATTAAPSGATTTSSYDPAGNKLTSTDPNGIITTWSYTPLNKAATESFSGSSAHSVTYSYDASGNKAGMVDATGTSSNVYDPFGELTSSTNGAGQATTYGYDADSDVTGITYPLPGTHSWAATTTVSYGYDNADQLTGVTDFNSHAITITPNADGLASSVSLGSTGDTINRTYDNTDGLSAITLKNGGSTLQSFTYSDAPSGSILNESDTPSSSQSPAVYTYDAQGRVTSMTPGTGSPLNFAFDPSSNLTTLPTGASTSYDKAGELTSSTLAGTATSYAYNSDGERLSDTQGATVTASGTWDGARRLVTYSDAAGNMSSATYDGGDLRATATYGASTQHFVWNNVSTLPQALMDSANAYIYTSGVAPAEQVNVATGAVTYLVTDSLGSVRGAVSSSGSLTGSTNYDAWGNPESTGGLTAATPFGFAGGYTDPVGLIYLQHRYYDPQAGQFLSVDPLVDRTLQSYSYANGDPVNDTDPSGMRSTFGEALRPGCSPISCWSAQLTCWRDNWHCSIAWGMTFQRKYAAVMIDTLNWILYVNGIYVWAGSYSHSELGSYMFHSYWGAPTATHSRGEFTCGKGHHCWLYPWSWIELGAYGTWTDTNGDPGDWWSDANWNKP
jgi:RHS repeat-associated protein